MPRVTFALPHGGVEVVDVAAGVSVMQAAVASGVDGIVAECGGNLMCATCHVYVAPEYISAVPAPSSEEDEMLDCTAEERAPNSRLSCQLIMAEALDGLSVRLPNEQIS